MLGLCSLKHFKLFLDKMQLSTTVFHNYRHPQLSMTHLGQYEVHVHEHFQAREDNVA